MKLLRFETIQPKGCFIIPENTFVSYKQSDKSKEERNSGTLTYKVGAKTLSIEIKAPDEKEWILIASK